MRYMFLLASVCLSACMYVCNMITFESLDLNSSFLVCRYSSKAMGKVRIYRSSGHGQGQDHRNNKGKAYVTA